jgi:hypothetical protein
MPLLGPDGAPIGAQPQPAANEPQPPKQVVTAFITYQLPDGRWTVTDDLTDVMVVMRKPSFDDLIAGSANVQSEIAGRKTANLTAQTTIQTQMAITRQMEQQKMSHEEARAAKAAMSGVQIPPGFRRG